MRKRITKLGAITLLLLLFIGNYNLYGQAQIIGSFPSVGGGFEPFTPITLASANSSTTWYQNSSGVLSKILTTSASSAFTTKTARTGSNFLEIPAQTSTGKYPVCPIVLGLTASTSYVLQFYYRTATAIAAGGIQVSTYPDKNKGSLTLAASTSWTMGYGIFTTNPATGTTVMTTPLSAGFNLNSAILPLIDIDDAVLYAGTALDVTPPDAPTAPVVANTTDNYSSSRLNVSWTAPDGTGPGGGIDGGGYVVVRGTADPTAVPNANGIYAVGNTVSDGVGTAGTVVYIGTGTSFTDQGLTASTHYYYRIYSVDKAFNYASAIAADLSTNAPNYATEPTVQASAVNFSGVTSTSFTVNWTAGTDATNSIVVIKAGSAGTTNPSDGTSYTANAAFSSGTSIGTTNYVVYNGTGNSVTVTGLAKATTYYVQVYSFNGSAGSENYLTTSPAAGSQMTSYGEISSVGTSYTGTWATAASWVGGVVPTSTDNVTIAAGDNIQVAATASCNNLTVNGKLYNNVALPSTSSVYLTVYGNTINCNGTLGDKTDAGTADCGFGICFNGNLTINGTGTIRPSRIYPNTNTTNATLTINANTQMTYYGSTGAGGAGIYLYNSANDNITLTVNPSVTLSFVNLSYLGTTSSTTVNAGGSSAINVNGTINLPSTSYLTLPVTSGKTSTLTVNGTLNVGKFSTISATGGAIPTITVGGSGSINVNTSADFSSPALSGYVGGTGAFALNSGASINIATITGLEPGAGPVRTTTRTFDPGATYAFVGTSAQATGSDLPATVNNLTISNATGVTLSSPVTINGVLALTSGQVSLGANNLIVTSTGSITGSSATNYIVTNGAGTLTQTIAAGATATFPVGASATSYDPAILTPTGATDVAVNVGTTLPAAASADYSFNAKTWNITPTAPSSTVVTLTPSTVVTTIVRDVIGQYISSNYVNTPATRSGNGYSATFSTFAPFVTGTTDLGTSISQTKITGVYFDGQIIHNDANLNLQVYDATGRMMVSSIKNINMSSSPKGVYVVKSNSGTLKIVL